MIVKMFVQNAHDDSYSRNKLSSWESRVSEQRSKDRLANTRRIATGMPTSLG